MSDEEGVGRRFVILYGSQTGNAQDVAERIARQGRRRGIEARVFSMDEYDITNLINELLVVFIISTTGNGDFPTPSLGFWKFLLRSTLPPDILADLTYTTFGLGDSSYARYCWPSRKLCKRLTGLGAEELMEGGEGDDQHYLGIEGTLRPWMDKLWQRLEEILPPLQQGAHLIGEGEPLPPTISVRVGQGKAGDVNGSAATSSSKTLAPGWQWARLTRNERMTSEDHWQDVRLVELEARDGAKIEYESGDVVALMPENSSEDTERLIERMDWTAIADRVVSLDSSQALPSALSLHPNMTLRRLIQTYIDFNSVPRPSFFEQILPFTPLDHMQREKLEEFCTPGEGSDEMYEYAIRVRRTILETLEEFDSVSIPLSHLLDIFPPIRRREFSIASGPGRYPNSVQLAIAIVSYKTRLKERRKGVCSSWLSALQVDEEVAIQIAKSTTHLPSNPALPAIFIGPGTGVAPIRSFLQQRSHLLSNDAMRSEDNLCFFGFRNRSKDWLFSDEWQTMAAEGHIDYHLAASRDQDKKVYVQHLIKQEAAKVWDILANRGGYLYICGSSGKMPQAVRQSVVDLGREEGKLDEQQAEAFVAQLEIQSRWLEECWS